MKPDRYEPSPSGTRRLSGFLQRRGSKLGLPTWGGFLFGGVFLAIGTGVVLVGTKVLPVNPASVQAPYWVLVMAGGSFALGGLMVWGMAWKQLGADRQRIEAARRHANEPALADYHWHPDGFEVSEWGGAAKAAALAIGLTVFLSMFNWWAFAAHGPGMVKAIVILFDVFGLLMWCRAALTLGRALKFGHSRIAFTRFPYPLGEPVIIRWRPGGGISRVRKGLFTLRCVVEWTECGGADENRTSTLVHEEIWSAKWVLEETRNLGLKEGIELRYELPPDAQPTRLSADKPVFWELEVKLDLPGLNFKECYLVPIYGSGTGSTTKPALQSC
ncbi:MAG: hypothetical protein ACLQVX_25655 [Limisphaerales bacterium]